MRVPAAGPVPVMPGRSVIMRMLVGVVVAVRMPVPGMLVFVAMLVHQAAPPARHRWNSVRPPPGMRKKPAVVSIVGPVGSEKTNDR